MLKEKLANQFDFLRATTPPLIGVDISSSYVKMVELAEAGKGLYRVERYVIEPLPKDTITDGNKRDAILANAPKSEYGCFVVPKVIDHE